MIILNIKINNIIIFLWGYPHLYNINTKLNKLFI